MSALTTLIDMGDAVHDLVTDLSRWSQATFGTDQERGPIGALKHLAKEAAEAVAAVQSGNRKDAEVELADCLILIYDAARRFGVKPMELHKLAYEKVQVNKQREWPKPTSDEPVEHVREKWEVVTEAEDLVEKAEDILGGLVPLTPAK